MSCQKTVTNRFSLICLYSNFARTWRMHVWKSRVNCKLMPQNCRTGELARKTITGIPLIFSLLTPRPNSRKMKPVEFGALRHIIDKKSERVIICLLCIYMSRRWQHTPTKRINHTFQVTENCFNFFNFYLFNINFADRLEVHMSTFSGLSSWFLFVERDEWNVNDD